MLLICVVACLGSAREGMATPDANSRPLVYVQRKMRDTVPAPAVSATAKSYHYKIFKSADGTYGYDIFAGPKKLIHQATVPGQPGNKGFALESSAAKVATLVMSKLQQNIFPPAVSTAELKQLGVRY